MNSQKLGSGSVSGRSCHVCGNPANLLGVYSPYTDVDAEVFDCDTCGSLTSPYDADAHLILHAENSSYDWHYTVAARSHELFCNGPREQLKHFLCEHAKKYRFIIESVEKFVPTGGRVLEIGCSTGALGSWLIANGYDYLGVDVSPVAIATAKRNFGEKHFAATTGSDLRDVEKFDAVFHVGTIGCVEDPLAVTTELLKLVKPNGVLLFNAPNRDACVQKRQLWVEGTHPPDLTSLFRPAFWQKQFEDVAATNVEVEYVPGWAAFRRLVSAYSRGTWKWEPRNTLVKDANSENSPTDVPKQRRSALKAASAYMWRKTVGSLFSVFFRKAVATEFGIFVTMRPKTAAGSEQAA